MSVKRTSYLSSRQARSARGSSPPTPAARQRPKTASTASRRCRPPDKRGPAGSKTKSKNSKNNKKNNKPLLSRQETEFLFGRGAATTDDDEVPQRAPSLRQTTLGRMLLRSSGSPLATSCTSNLRRRAPPASLSESDSASFLYRRPLSADSCCSGRTTRRRKRTVRGLGKNGINISGTSAPSKPTSTCAGGGKAAVTAVARTRNRPSSAAPGDGCRGTWRPSLSTAAADNLPASQLDSEHHPNTSRTSRNHMRGGENTVVRKFSARSHSDRGEATACTTHDGGSGLTDGGATTSGRVGGQPAMTVHQALEATIKAATDAVSPLDQFVNARKTIAEMKNINTKDSTGDVLLSTQVGH